MTVTLDILHAAMNLSGFDQIAAQERMAPRPRGRLHQYADVPAKQAGVLALFYPEAAGELHLVLTRRQDTLRGHAGQVSFPGGKHDPQDADFTFTALRETHEELGIEPHPIQVVGKLASFYVPPSNFDVHPTVGYLPHKPDFRPNPAEVAQVITFPARMLLEPERKNAEDQTFNGMKIRIPYYTIHGHKVWGATAAMLGELEGRISAAR